MISYEDIIIWIRSKIIKQFPFYIFFFCVFRCARKSLADLVN